jgi:hypothetical protein
MAPKFDLSVLGTSGLQHQNGRVDTEMSRHLCGNRGPLLYAEMADNSAVIGAVINIVKSFLRQATWVTTPSDEKDPESIDWADFVEGCRNDMSHTWSDFISEVLSLVPYGWSFFELCYKERRGVTNQESSDSKYDDGLIGWRKISIRPQNTLYKWKFDDEMGVQGMWQLPPNQGFYSAAGQNNGAVLIPMERALLFRTESTGNNPQGRSLLRNSVQPYLFVKRMQEIEAVGTERDLSGYPVFEAPLSMFSGGGENHAMLAQLQQTLCDIRRDGREGAVVPCEVDSDGPTGFKLRLMTGGGTRALNLDAIIRRHESRMAMPLLAEFILLGTDKVGSFSMHASKQDVFATSLRGLLQSIADVINRYGVTRLCRINGCPVDKIPTLVPGDVAAPPLNEIVAYVQGMASAGMIMHDAATERWVRQQAGMPEPEAEEDMVDAAQQAVPPQPLPDEEPPTAPPPPPPPPGGGGNAEENV